MATSHANVFLGGTAVTGPRDSDADATTSSRPMPPPPPPALDLVQLRAAGLVGSPSGPSSGDARFDALKAEVDALQVEVMRQKAPWFRDAASIVAILALVFSFGTTVVSFQKTASDDLHASEIELRTLIGRLSALPLEALRSSREFEDDAGALSVLNSLITQEQILVAKHAAAAIEALPDDRVTSAQRLLVGNILVGNQVDDLGLALLDEAINTARDSNDYISALRSYGFRLFQVNRVDFGREQYRLALLAFERFPSSSPAYVTYSHLQTHIGWAQAELSVGNCAEARIQAEEARALAGGFASTDAQIRRLASVEAQIVGCNPAATPGLASPSPGAP